MLRDEDGERPIADFSSFFGRYTDFLVNEIGEDGKVVHLTNLEYGGRGKQQQVGAGNSQKTETETGTETGKQEKKDEGESTKQEKAPPTAPVKEFEVPRALPDMLNM